MSLVFKLGYSGGAWVDKATGKTVYEVASDYPVTTVWGVKGPAAYYAESDGSGTAGYLYLADSADFSFGASAFTINMWFMQYETHDNESTYLFSYGSTSIYMYAYIWGTTKIYLRICDTTPTPDNICVVEWDLDAPDPWLYTKRNHIEIGRSSAGTFCLDINGQEEPITQVTYSGAWSSGFTIPEITGSFYIGKNLSSSVAWGVMEDFSIYKGECLHPPLPGIGVTPTFNPSYPGLLPGFQVM